MSALQPSGGFEWAQAAWGPALRCAPLGATAPHLFTVGNLRLREDEREWAALAAQFGADVGALRLIRQVHGVDVARVGAANGRWEMPRADVIVSDDPGAVLAVLVADCAPVLLADRRLGVVAAVHAGWRGTAKGAAMVAVRALAQEFGSIPSDVTAAIGPCLGPCCGEVGPEVLDAFRAEGHPHEDLARWFSPGRSDRVYLNLWDANRDQLHRAGALPVHIHTAEVCTRTHAAVMHSYRAAGPQAGRMAGVIKAVARP